MNFYDDRAVKFCQNIAQGLSPEKAAIEAGYSKKTARAKAYKWLEDDRAVSEIEKWKEKAKEVIEQEFNYNTKVSFDKLCEIQELALKPDDKGNYCNLSSAIKAEELKGKMYGVYEAENQQSGLTINYIRNYE